MRVKTGVVRSRRHKKVLDMAKGYRLARSSHYKVAHESVLHAGMHAYIGRKLRKRDFRRLWIQRITAGLHNVEGAPSYSVFMHLLKTSQVELNRKMLAELVINDLDTFAAIVKKVNV